MIYGHFRPQRHRLSAVSYRRARTKAFRTWRKETSVLAMPYRLHCEKRSSQPDDTPPHISRVRKLREHDLASALACLACRFASTDIYRLAVGNGMVPLPRVLQRSSVRPRAKFLPTKGPQPGTRALRLAARAVSAGSLSPPLALIFRCSQTGFAPAKPTPKIVRGGTAGVNSP